VRPVCISTLNGAAPVSFVVSAHTMPYIRYTLLLALSLLLAGCTVQRGHLDFPNPIFDLHCGPITFIALPSSTVVWIGGTYFTLSLPFYVPLVLIVTLVTVLWFLLRRRGHA
jgi:hypothetical protein